MAATITTQPKSINTSDNCVILIDDQFRRNFSKQNYQNIIPVPKNHLRKKQSIPDNCRNSKSENISQNNKVFNAAFQSNSSAKKAATAKIKYEHSNKTSQSLNVSTKSKDQSKSKTATAAPKMKAFKGLNKECYTKFCLKVRELLNKFLLLFNCKCDKESIFHAMRVREQNAPDASKPIGRFQKLINGKFHRNIWAQTLLCDLTHVFFACHFASCAAYEVENALQNVSTRDEKYPNANITARTTMCLNCIFCIVAPFIVFPAFYVAKLRRSFRIKHNIPGHFIYDLLLSELSFAVTLAQMVRQIRDQEKYNDEFGDDSDDDSDVDDSDDDDSDDSDSDNSDDS